MIGIIDTHTHYENERFNDDRDELINSLQKNGVEMVINVGCDMKTSKESVELARKYHNVYTTVGFHPHYVKSLNEKNLQEIINLSKNEKVVGFGETGLDFFHNFSPKDTQRYWFRRLLEVANGLNLPVIIHSRDANDEVFETISASKVRNGVIHAFSGDAVLVKAYVDMGFYIGIGGVVTFKKTDVLSEAVNAVPLEKILLETDCPYLAPEPYRGKRNESAYLSFVAKKIAKIKGVTVEAVIAKTNENAKKLFFNKGKTNA